MRWPLSIFTSSPPRTLLFFFLSLSLLSLYTLHHHHRYHHLPIATFKFHHEFLQSASNSTISTYLHSLTLHPHLAGTPSSLQTSNYVLSHFRSLSLPTHLNHHDVLLSYPLHSSLSAHSPNGTSSTIPLSEPTRLGGVVIPYHAYSPSGTVYGKAVYVHHGREQDYVRLARMGVDVSGCVAVVKRGGGLSRNVAVEKAAEKGAVAVLMYTDDDGNEGYRNGVERGTVMKDLGDPQTPGWAGGERMGLEEGEVVNKFPRVASMPISAETAEAILGTLDGARVPFEWRDGGGGGLKGKFERIGPGPTLLNFSYQGENKMATIRNIFAVIKGSEETDRFVMLGNHRDAWTYGAVDPNSGTAALLDIARRYALLMQSGWKPRRTIILCSWDAEEFGMIGSTEWVEQNLVNLGSKAITYLNVDCAVQGPGFFASATPQLDDLLAEVTRKVRDPDIPHMTLFENWAASNQGILIQRLSRVDSDFAPFLQHAGIPSVDLYYGRDFPVYHTAFDSYDWMINSGDPLFHRHVAITGVWGLLALHLADDPILPFNYLTYAAQLQNYMKSLSNFVKGDISFHPIAAAIQELKTAAEGVEEEAKKLREEETMGHESMLKRHMLNDRLMLAERGFLDAEGLKGRQWFKHLVYGPYNSENETLEFFPGIMNAISQPTTRITQRGRQKEIEHEIWRVARAIQRAASSLKGELT